MGHGLAEAGFFQSLLPGIEKYARANGFEPELLSLLNFEDRFACQKIHQILYRPF